MNATAFPELAVFMAAALALAGAVSAALLRPLRRQGERGLGVAAAAALPLAAFAVYAAIGTPAGLATGPATAGGEGPSATQVEAMVGRLAQSLQERSQQGREEPADAAGWALVARSLAQQQLLGPAREAFDRALALKPTDPGLLADQADLLRLIGGADALRQADALVARALAAAPDHPKARALADAARREREDPPKDLAAAPADATPAPLATAQVMLAPALSMRLAPGDAVFVVAQAAGGARMPLAILRLRVADLPAPVRIARPAGLDPATPVVLTARVARQGSALPQAGDAVSAPVAVAAGGPQVVLKIAQLLE